MAERAIARVPGLVLALLALGLAAQIGLKASSPQPRAKAQDLAPAPSIAALRLASFGDPVALAKALMLYLQAFDYQSGSKVPYRDLDYGRLEAWLARILELDPRGQYLPLARRYAAAIQRHATADDVPLWAKQMEIFILEDMDELQTARIMIGGYIQSGKVKDPAELRFLEERLKQLEARMRKPRKPE